MKNQEGGNGTKEPEDKQGRLVLVRQGNKETRSNNVGNAGNKEWVPPPRLAVIFVRLHSHLQESPLCLCDTVSAGPAGLLLLLPIPHQLLPIAPSPWLQVIMTSGTAMLVIEQPDTGGRVAIEFPQLGQREGKDAQTHAIR